MNRLLEALAEICRKHPLREKWLLAPNARAGHQWLEALARSGTGVVNLHVKTVRGLARDLAAPRMRALRISLLSKLGQSIVAQRVWERSARTGGGYLRNLTPTPRLFDRLASTLIELRRAGLSPADLIPERFEAPIKGRELGMLLGLWIEELDRIRRTDHGGVLALALERLRTDPDAAPGAVVALLPEDLELQGLEKELLTTVLAENLIKLPVDSPDSLPDSLHLSFFHAHGEINEAREALRRCLEAGAPLDRVEIVASDKESYVPILHELFESRFWPARGEENASPPITFADGIPASYSRPGKALTLWLEWIREGFPQALLVRMLEDGLIRCPEGFEGPGGPARLGRCLRGLAIGRGRERYLPLIEGRLAALKRRAERQVLACDDEGEVHRRDESRFIAEMEALSSLVGRLLDLTPPLTETTFCVVERARDFLETAVSSRNELDNFARREFLEEIEELNGWFQDGSGLPDLDLWDWLAGLPERTPLLGSRPREGALHVSSLAGGGHSGREHIYILGLDDTRFPGVGLQDPLLLDGERRRLSPELPTARDHLERKVENFRYLLARQRGRVTLSYTSRSVVEDREMFPSSAFGEQLEGCSDVDPERLPLASFTPSSAERALHLGEWWLWRLGESGGSLSALGSVAACHPHLGQGLLARLARDSDRFTAFDGRIAGFEGGPDDPTTQAGPTLSASALQTAGRCPLAYFFKHVLRIEPPDDFEEDPTRWLDSLEFGSLLHEVFHRFISELLQRSEKPKRDLHWDLLQEILRGAVKRYREEIPPPSESVFSDRLRELERAAHVFLVEEEVFGRTGSPVFLEASVGMRSGAIPTALDSLEPVRLELEEGVEIRARGRIDRVDLTSSGRYAIWDYKTGGAKRFGNKDPFLQGRLLQHALYIDLVRERLREIIGPDAEVESFGYFFPGAQEHGERISWTPEKLQDGLGVASKLLRLITGGSFVPTENRQDCEFCDHRACCGDLDLTTSQSDRKLK
ncbi:MAG: PD-(D/E)XK nuclease family protein, partial [Candidatus Omnitrophica bacterium]|nr:PD-(D/E)XK nuclease family protein [Candidatus Omnitrophota bacterium]